MKRILDFSIAVLSSLILLFPMLLVAAAIKISSPGPMLFWSDRVGKNNDLFRMPKFRTMRFATPNVATHLLDNPDDYLTSIGALLRKTSLDELPQLYSILVGDMSFVGPRPALFNQYDLIELRTHYGIHKLTPGLTGWAQINGRDELPIQDKVAYDHEYMLNKSLWRDMKIFWLTFSKVLAKKDISH